METMAVRLHGKKKLSLDRVKIPSPGKREIRAKIITNSLCFSTYKAWEQGEDHKRTPDDLEKNPIVVGHEFAGIIEEPGEELRGEFSSGERFIVQPAIFYRGPLFVHGGVYGAPGYSFPYCGGNAQDVIIPQQVVDSKAVITFKNSAFFEASLAEPVSCIIGAAREQYHCDLGKHRHIMGIKEGGNLAILGGGGPMGLAMLDYFLHADRKPSLIMVVEIDSKKLERARRLSAPAAGETQIFFVNPAQTNIRQKAAEITGSTMFDDVFTMFPSAEVLKTADMLLGEDGTNNFFAGPSDRELTAPVNFYQVHYAYHKHIGSSGGNTRDLEEAINMMEAGRLNPEQMISAVGGLDSVPSAIPRLPSLSAGKNLIYTGISMPLTPVSDFGNLSENSETPEKLRKVYAELHRITASGGGLWSREAEDYLLKHSGLNFRI